MNTWTPNIPPWMYYPQTPQNNLTLQDILTGQKYLDELKKSFEEEDKKKKEKRKRPEAPKFSFMELWGFVMLFSIPVTLGQMYLIQLAQSKLAEIATSLVHTTPH